MQRKRVLRGASLALAGAAAAYTLLLRDWCVTWGAKPEEVTRGMPGDELIPEPDMLATRAITVHAPRSAIWPWLVQMGSGRGGAYAYDWIENIFGLDMHSADEILPQSRTSRSAMCCRWGGAVRVCGSRSFSRSAS